MSFCTAINCMDGRVQIPVINYLKEYFKVKYVDSITFAGPNRILAEHTNIGYIEAIMKRLEISVKHHGSIGIAIIGHYDCAGNPATKDEQNIHTQEAIEFLKNKYQDIEIIGLWVDKSLNINKI